MPSSTKESVHPSDTSVGIVALDIYFPQQYISQEELEVHDNVDKGKYTQGLGQQSMSFCYPHEDAISMALNVTQNLLQKYSISPKSIGRIECGSESNPDRSKSIKSWLTILHPEEWKECGGADSLNACYGGTAALLNVVNWIESSEWDGRHGLVVMADIAEYPKNSKARATGGAGAVALLIGKGSKVILALDIHNNRRKIVHYCRNTFDFFKPTDCQFPIVDGPASVQNFLEAFRICHEKYSSVDYQKIIMHTPFVKIVKKACDLVGASFSEKAQAGTRLSAHLGNLYTGSLYASLISLIDSGEDFNRVLLFSYGSGCIASMFALVKVGSLEDARVKLNIGGRLASRTKVSVPEYDSRGTNWNSSNLSNLNIGPEGVYFLELIRGYRRFYNRTKATK